MLPECRFLFFFMSNNKIYSFLAINIQLNYTTFILYTLIRKIKKKKKNT